MSSASPRSPSAHLLPRSLCILRSAYGKVFFCVRIGYLPCSSSGSSFSLGFGRAFCPLPLVVPGLRPCHLSLSPPPLSPSLRLVHVDSCRSLSPVLSVASLPILEAKRHSSAHKTITHHLTDALQNYRPQLPLMPPSLTPSLPSSRRSFLWACNCCSLARTVRSFIDCCILIIVTMLCVLSVRPSVLPCLVLLPP